MQNVLIEYQGGGYDGCVWEWNYCLVDKKGKFHDIVSSGSGGIDHKEQLITRMVSTFEKLGDSFYIYNLSNPADLKNFATNSNVHGVLGVAQWIESHQLDISDNPIPLICPCCKLNCNSEEISFAPNDYQGDGGIGIQFNSLLCHECNSLYSCGYCGEYYGEDYEDFTEEGFCEYCAEAEAKREAQREYEVKKADYEKWIAWTKATYN